MKKLIFRADGSSAIGLGHLYRIFALIEMYRSDCECILLTKESSSKVIPKEYNVVFMPDSVSIEMEPKWIKEKFNFNDCWIIADGYSFNSEWQKKIKGFQFKLVYIDDLCHQHMYADVVINHALGVTKADYSKEPYTKLALGTQYAILRPKFLESAAKPRNTDKFHKAFVCFGGSDPLNLTTKACKALLKKEWVSSVKCVVGAAYAHDDIFKLSTQDSRLKVFQNISETELINLMKSSDFAIAPASTISYELCAVKMPILSGYYVENQKKIYEGSLDKGLVYGLGNFEHFTETNFGEKIDSFISEKDHSHYIAAQSLLFDGQIKQRFLDLITEIKYRKAEIGDMELVFNWANDKLSRANSYFSEPISLETHKNWFEKKLKDSNCYIYIAEHGNKPAGMVRYELASEHTVVGILVSEDFRGKKLASGFLTETAKIYFKENSKPVLAYIKIENTASIKTFEKAGYCFFKEEVIHGHKSVVYKLNKSDVQ